MSVLLVVYCLMILLASLVGGWIPLAIRLTHRRMQIALSFVSGVMLGVAVLHLVPHAAIELAHDDGPSLDVVMLWLLAGFLMMFLLERFFCFHHHEADDDHRAHSGHTLGWAGATVGLVVHSVLAGGALAASVQSQWEPGDSRVGPAGLATFLVIVLHKPFDSLTIGTLLAAGDAPRGRRHLINSLFSLAVPVGAVLFVLGAEAATGPAHAVVGAMLAFAAGMFLCIALSDLLPELQFHHHDRLALTGALIAGLILAWVVGLFEGDLHDHAHEHGPAESHVHE